MRQEAAASREWEVDAVPIMARFEDGRSPRPVLMLVVAGAAILHHAKTTITPECGGINLDQKITSSSRYSNTKLP